MNEARSTQPAVLVTGVSGDLGQRLLRQLAGFRVIGVDVREPQLRPAEFHTIDLGRESSFQELLQVFRDTAPVAVVHLAFIVDQVRSGVTDVDRMWRINVAGAARVMEAITVLNRQSSDGPMVRKFVFLSSVSAYGPDLVGEVKENCPLSAHTLPYAIHKREADLVVQERSAALGDCSTYILRPHIFAGATVRNYILDALRGVPSGKSARARKWREQGKRLPILLPRGRKYLENRIQFVHIDDVARLLAHILHCEDDPQLTIMNVAGDGEPLTIVQCAAIAGTDILQVPTRWLCRLLIKLGWKLGISSFPPEAFQYLTGSQVMELTRLREFLGSESSSVMRYSSEEALRAAFAPESDEEKAADLQGCCGTEISSP